jgi:hypothetical protein
MDEAMDEALPPLAVEEPQQPAAEAAEQPAEEERNGAEQQEGDGDAPPAPPAPAPLKKENDVVWAFTEAALADAAFASVVWARVKGYPAWPVRTVACSLPPHAHQPRAGPQRMRLCASHPLQPRRRSPRAALSRLLPPAFVPPPPPPLLLRLQPADRCLAPSPSSSRPSRQRNRRRS